MNNAAFKNVTPNAKLAMVNAKLGNKALGRNQGSTVEIYDYINVTANVGNAATIRFFDGVNTRQFPFTNLQQNQLQVGEALAIQYIALTRITVNRSNKITSQSSILTAAGLALSQLNILLDNSRILKNNSLTRANSIFNTQGHTGTNNLFYPDTDLTLPPQISFTAELQTPANSDTAPAEEDVYYGCHLFGTGAILNLKTNV